MAEDFTLPAFLQDCDVDTIHQRMMDMLPDDIDKTEAGFPWDFTRPTALIASELLEYYIPEAAEWIQGSLHWICEISNHGPVCERRNVIMANVIIQDERRQADIEYVAKKYGIDTNNPAMREAAEVTAVRSREAMEMGRTQRRYY